MSPTTRSSSQTTIPSSSWRTKGAPALPRSSPQQEKPAAAKPEPIDGKKDREAAKDKVGKEKDDEDPQLQKAVELLKSWMIFKDLRPVKRDDRVEHSM